MPVATQGQARQLIPFRLGTRQRIQQFGSTAISLGTQFVQELPRVGMLAGIILNVSATVTLSSIGALALFSPFSLFKRIKVNLNTGAASVFDCSGFGTASVMASMQRAGLTPTDSDLMQVPVASGANTWAFSLYIPIAINDHEQFQNGLINLQAPEIRCTCEITFASAGSEFVTNFTSITGTVYMTYIFYEVPNPSVVQYPPLALCRTLEERQAITAVGDQVYTFPRGGLLLNLCHVVTLNGLLATWAQGVVNQSNLVDSMRMVINKTDTVYSVIARAQAVFQKLKSPIQYPTGPSFGSYQWMWNFLDATEAGTGSGDTRDSIDSEAVSVLESIVTVNSGATVGATAFLDSIRRIYQPLQA